MTISLPPTDKRIMSFKFSIGLCIYWCSFMSILGPNYCVETSSDKCLPVVPEKIDHIQSYMFLDDNDYSNICSQ